jgi:hypothetical protein
MMPSTSKKQHNFMAAIAHSPSFAKKVGVPQSVGKDFNEADKGRKFSKGGDTMASKMDPRMMAMMAAKPRGGDRPPMGGMGVRPPMGGMGARPPMGGMGARPPMAPPGMKKGGMAAFEKSGKDAEKKGMKEGSKADMAMDKKQMAMKTGGMPMVMKDGKKIPAFAADGQGKMKSGGVAKKMNMGGMTSMGKVKTNPGNINGVAERGKTKGKMITMKRGGRTC